MINMCSMVGVHAMTHMSHNSMVGVDALRVHITSYIHNKMSACGTLI